MEKTNSRVLKLNSGNQRIYTFRIRPLRDGINIHKVGQNYCMPKRHGSAGILALKLRVSYQNWQVSYILCLSLFSVESS